MVQTAEDPLSMTFAALADPTRRAILARLAEAEKGEKGGEEGGGGGVSVTELAKPFDMTLPAISKHLKVLEKAGLIERGRQAQWRPCRLRGEPLKQVAGWVEQYRAMWEERFDRLAAYLKEAEGEEGRGP